MREWEAGRDVGGSTRRVGGEWGGGAGAAGGGAGAAAGDPLAAAQPSGDGGHILGVVHGPQPAHQNDHLSISGYSFYLYYKYDFNCDL